MAPPIYILPTALRRYKLKTVSSPRDDQCPLCWRNYGTIHNTSDSTEIPCRAVQVLPCRHEFGNECVKQMKKEGIFTCPACRTALAVAPDKSLERLAWAATLAPFKFLTDCIIARMRLRSDSDIFDHLNQRLFDGTINLLESFWLWYLYTAACFAVVLSVLLRGGVTYVSVGLLPHIAVGIFEDKLSPEWLCSLANYRCLYENGTVINLQDASSCWADSVLRHISGPLVLAILVWVAFAAVVARLISAGAWSRDRG